MEWDTAAGHAVLLAAGGQVWDPRSQPLRYGKPQFRNPWFVASGALVPHAVSAVTSGHSLSAHLKRLEAESIGIMREVAAEFANPVMLYSIGKDSGVMLHLALKAFFPSKPPFSAAACGHGLEVPRHDPPPRHDRRALWVQLLTYTNQDGVARGINPIRSGSRCTPR